MFNKKVIYDEVFEILDIVDGEIVDMTNIVSVKKIKNINIKKPSKTVKK